MGRRKKTSDNFDSLFLNNRAYIYQYNRIKELAISRFKWNNLPDTIDERFLELTLFEQGMAVFFDDDVLGYLALTTMIGGMLDVYRIPTQRTAYANNGFNMHLDNTDSVIIWNNKLHENMIYGCEMFARRLYECDRTIDVNIKAQKTPILITCSENQRLTLKNTYEQYTGNAPVIFADKDIDILKNLQAIPTLAPYVADKLLETKTQIWNECLTWLGISNTNYQKKERLISDEVSRNMGGTVASRNSGLDMRKQACDEINKMFGLNVSVEFNDDINEEAINKNEDIYNADKLEVSENE